MMALDVMAAFIQPTYDADVTRTTPAALKSLSHALEVLAAAQSTEIERDSHVWTLLSDGPSSTPTRGRAFERSNLPPGKPPASAERQPAAATPPRSQHRGVQ